MHHEAEMRAAEQRHIEQMRQMEKHHAEQVLVLRTALLAIEKDSGVRAARDPEGNLIGGVHHEGEFTAVPDVSLSVIEDTTSKQEGAAELQDEPESRDRESTESSRSAK
jgi:hypothetical protein